MIGSSCSWWHECVWSLLSVWSIQCSSTGLAVCSSPEDSQPCPGLFQRRHSPLPLGICSNVSFRMSKYTQKHFSRVIYDKSACCRHHRWTVLSVVSPLIYLFRLKKRKRGPSISSNKDSSISAVTSSASVWVMSHSLCTWWFNHTRVYVSVSLRWNYVHSQILCQRSVMIM